MAKKLLHDYTFTRDTQDSAGAALSKGGIVVKGIIPQERFLLMTDISTGTIIQNFADVSKGITSVSFNHTTDQTTVVTEYDTQNIDSQAKIQIFVEDILGEEVHLGETYIDPVSKIRVSNPENMIDTDFEYGLQSTKWETLELVKNIPTFFSRNGDLELSVTSINSTSGSSNISVVTSEPHGMSRGNPILVAGTTSYLANGGFVVTAVQDDYTFSFSAKEEIPSTGNIKDTYTQIFVGNVYSGTEFDLSNISGIITDQDTPKSKLTVVTKWPTNFTEGTSFFLSNSFAKANIEFSGDSSGVSTELYGNVTQTRANKTATGELADPAYSALGGIDTYSVYQPQTIPTHSYEFNDGQNGRVAYYMRDNSTINSGSGRAWFTPHGDEHWRAGLYVDPAELTVDTGANTITFGFNHGILDWQYMYYHVGDGNTAIGGLYDRLVYMIKVVNATTIQICGPQTRPGANNASDTFSSNYISLTAAPVSGLTSKMGFLFVLPYYRNRQGNVFYLTYDYGALSNNRYFKYSSVVRTGHTNPYSQWQQNWKFQHVIPYNGPSGVEGSGYNHVYSPSSWTTYHMSRFGSYYGVPFYAANNNDRFQQAAKIEMTKRGDNYATQLYNRTTGPNPPGSFRTLADASPTGQPGVKSRLHYGSSISTGANHYFRATTSTGSNTYTGRSHLGSTTTFYHSNNWNMWSSSLDYVNKPVHWVPYIDNTMSNSLYFPGHTFADGNLATLTWDSGPPSVSYPSTFMSVESAPAVYEIDYVNSNRVRLLDSTGQEVNFINSGDSNLDYTLTASQFNTIHNSILITGNNLQDGDQITYTNNGATNIPGLTTGTDYFITNRSTNYVSLATTKALFTANVGVNLTQNGTNVVTATNRIYGGGATAWTDGSLVRFTSTGVAPKGLGDGRWYYIKKYTAISNAWLQFFTNKADALAGTNPIGISDVGSGSYTIKESTMVDLTGIYIGTHLIATNFI